MDIINKANSIINSVEQGMTFRNTIAKVQYNKRLGQFEWTSEFSGTRQPIKLIEFTKMVVDALQDDLIPEDYLLL